MNQSLKLIGGAITGAAVAYTGTVLRFGAKSMSWPKEYSYSGPREATDWAILERAYQDFGLCLIVFGFALLLVTFSKWLQD
jgi:hypothetical protein